MQTLTLTPAEFKLALASQINTLDIDFGVQVGEVLYVCEPHTITEVNEETNEVTVKFTTPSQELTFKASDKVIIDALKAKGKKQKPEQQHPSLCRLAIQVVEVGEPCKVRTYQKRQ